MMDDYGNSLWNGDYDIHERLMSALCFFGFRDWITFEGVYLDGEAA